MMQNKKQTKAEQREVTIARLIEVAHRIFSEQGYASASTEEIVRLAGVTRGALYHHFPGKEGLFRAVFEDAQREIARRVEQAVSRSELDLWQELITGCRAFLEACIDPQLQQIVIIDAPAVLGWDVWRQLDAQNSLVLLKASLDELVKAGIIQPIPVEALAHLLSGAMNEAAVWIAQMEDKQQALEETISTLEMLLTSLKT